MQSGATAECCSAAAATAGRLNLKLIQTNGLKSKSQTQMLICLLLELAQEATSKGEKISNIDSIMREIYGAQRYQGASIRRDTQSQLELVSLWVRYRQTIQIKIMLDILV